MEPSSVSVPSTYQSRYGASNGVDSQQCFRPNYDQQMVILQLQARIRELERDLERSSFDNQEAYRRNSLLANTVQQLCLNSQPGNAWSHHRGREGSNQFGTFQSKLGRENDHVQIHQGVLAGHGDLLAGARLPQKNAEHDHDSNPDPRFNAPNFGCPTSQNNPLDDLLPSNIRFTTSKQFLEESADSKSTAAEIGDESKAHSDYDRPLQHIDVGRQTLDDVFAENESVYSDAAQASETKEKQAESVEDHNQLGRSEPGKVNNQHEASDNSDPEDKNGNAEKSNAWDEIEDKELREGMLALQNARIKRPPPTVHDTGFHFEDLVKRGDEHSRTPTTPRAMRFNGVGSYSAPTYRNDDPRYEMHIQGSGAPHEQTDLWDNLEEREELIRNTRQHDSRFHEIFRYGLRFNPEPSNDNYMRTVMISDLPQDTELKAVLQRVRGGSIVNASLLDTRKLINGTMSAMVVFCRESDAAEYLDYVAKNPITFGPENKQAKFQRINTPTYPDIIPRCKGRFNHHQTRALQIEHIPAQHTRDTLVGDISCGNAWRTESIMEVYYDDCSVLNIEFSNINMAGSSYGILTQWNKYLGMQVRFANDPCSQALCTLKDPLPVRKPYIPPPPQFPSAFPRHGSGSYQRPSATHETAREFAPVMRDHPSIARETMKDLTPLEQGQEKDIGQSSNATESTGSRGSSFDSVTTVMTSLFGRSSTASWADQAEEEAEELVKNAFRKDGFRQAPLGLGGSRFAMPEVKRGELEEQIHTGQTNTEETQKAGELQANKEQNHPTQNKLQPSTEIEPAQSESDHQLPEPRTSEPANQADDENVKVEELSAADVIIEPVRPHGEPSKQIEDKPAKCSNPDEIELPLSDDEE